MNNILPSNFSNFYKALEYFKVFSDEVYWYPYIFHEISKV
jgi:hypothetical protein